MVNTLFGMTKALDHVLGRVCIPLLTKMKAGPSLVTLWDRCSPKCGSSTFYGIRPLLILFMACCRLWRRYGLSPWERVIPSWHLRGRHVLAALRAAGWPDNWLGKRKRWYGFDLIALSSSDAGNNQGWYLSCQFRLFEPASWWYGNAG